MNVITLGSFDCLHPGHVYLFKQCANLAGFGGRVTVALNTDEFIGRFKPAPVQALAERLDMVMAVRYVDHVQINDGHRQPLLIEESGAEVIVVGDDWADRDYMAQLRIDGEWLDRHRIKIRYLPRVGGWSSTELKARVKTREYDYDTTP